VKLTIYRGANEVGGNCIEVATARTRLILDVGLPLFNKDREPLDTQALRRKSRNELREAGILPKVPGLFDEGPGPDAILLSHAHEDHTGLIRHSQPEIPIYAGIGTSKMMLAGSKFAGQPSLPRGRHRELRSGNPVQIGDFTVTPFSVDHSIYGSHAFLIEAEGKSVFYSGDLRLHGRKPGMHRAMIDALKSRTIDVLLMEGTHIGNPENTGPSEYDLEQTLTERIRSAPGLVLASFSPQHVDRLVGFMRATKTSGRVFIADAYTAFVMHLIASEIPIPRPESTDWVKIFFPRFFEESFRRKRLEEIYFLMSPARIGMDEIRSDPRRFVMLFRPSMLESDFGTRLPNDTLCLYSRWSGYLDRPDWRSVLAVLNNAGGKILEVHTSGHIFARDITTLIRETDAKRVIPIHTFEPGRFMQLSDRVSVVRDGEIYYVE
jgi:ribonuclease J